MDQPSCGPNSHSPERTRSDTNCKSRAGRDEGNRRCNDPGYPEPGRRRSHWSWQVAEARPPRPRPASRRSRPRSPAPRSRWHSLPSRPNQPLGPAPTAVGGYLTLDSRDVGLDQLKSYRVTWKADWETTKDGKTEQANWDWLLVFTADPVGSLTVWKGADVSGSAPGSWEHWEDGSNAGDVALCTWREDLRVALELAATSAQRRETQARSRDCSSCPACWAACQALNMPEPRPSTASGPTATRTTRRLPIARTSARWRARSVAADGGYVVKDTVSWEGGAMPFGDRRSHRRERQGQLDLGADRP